jgi:DNA-binding GntR family transcriptional regulator
MQIQPCPFAHLLICIFAHLPISEERHGTGTSRHQTRLRTDPRADHDVGPRAGRGHQRAGAGRGAGPGPGAGARGAQTPDLEQLSELRLSLEGLSARLAAQRATDDDLVILEALRREQASTPPEDSKRLFDVDHKFHQAVAQAAHNKYLADSLERLFGLSQRLWYLALPKLGFLPGAVEKHLDLVQAIKNSDGDQAERIMRAHVGEFYAQVREILAED